MTHTCCPACRLRFTRATAFGLEACPCCGEPLCTTPAEVVVGHRLWEETPRPEELPMAAAAVLPDPRQS